MSNIRPIGDPAVATAMLATMQSIDASRSPPSGISEPRWRILQCIANAAPNVPSPGELRLCSGLNKVALAEHVQALQWKGLLEMGGYRLSPSAAAMVGVEQPVIIGVDFSHQPDVSVKVTGRYRADGGFEVEKIDIVSSLDSADVPACMRPDCTPLEKPIPASAARKTKKPKKHGRGSAAAAHPIQGDVHRDRVAPDRALRTPEEVAGSNPAPGQPVTLKISAPPATPPKFTNWIEQRRQRIAGAIAFLGSLGIPVAVADRSAEIRTYFVSANRRSLFAEEVIEFAIEKGWAE